MPPSAPPPRGPTRVGPRPFPSPALNTYALPGVHGSRKRWALEAGRNAGLVVAVVAPLVGLLVVTPLVSLVAGVGGEMRPGWPCLKTEAEACPTPIQFDYYFWNVTNAVEWMAGAPPFVEEVGPYAFRARELRWNARFSDDQVNVTFTRTFYHEAFLPAASCAACSLADPVTTVNPAYLAVLASTGGTELPFVLGGVPAALTASLAAFEAGLVAGGVPAAVAPSLAARQWARCDVWPADTAAGIEWCAWAAGAAGVAPTSPAATLDDAAASLLLPLLLGSPAHADAQGSDPAARAAALFVGLLPPSAVAGALGVPPALAAAVQAYVRHAAVALVGPAFVSTVLGAPLAPASGGLVVRKTVDAWLAGWRDPLLAAFVAPGPRSLVSSAFAWPSAGALEATLGRPLAAIRGGDHPLVTDVTATTGEPTAAVDAAAGVFKFTDNPPGRVLAIDGSATAVDGGGGRSGLTVAVGGAFGDVLGGRVRSARAALPVYDATLRRPLTVTPAAGNNDTGARATVKGVSVRVYEIDAASAAPCDGGRGGVERCAAPDPYGWAWTADGLYATATQMSLPRFYKADALRAASLAPLPPASPSAHAWTMAVEPFMGRAIAGRKPFQVSHRVAATDVTARALGGRAPSSPANGWLATHWVRTSYELGDGDAARMRDGLRTVTAMRLGMSYAVPALAGALGLGCAALLHATPGAKATAAAAKLVAAARPAPTAIEGAETLAVAVEAGVGGSGT